MDRYQNLNKTQLRSLIESQEKSLSHKEKVIENQRNLLDKNTGISISGGFVDTWQKFGTFKKDFATPYQQALISEEMANDVEFGAIFQIASALAGVVKYELTYKDKSLLDDPLHKAILENIKTNIERLGGSEGLHKYIIEPALKCGIGIAIPRIDVEEITLPTEINPENKSQEVFILTGFKPVLLLNIMQMMFDENDTDRLSKFTYITQPKLLTSEVVDLLSDNDSINKTEDAGTELITIDVINNCIAIGTNGSAIGDPIGLPYLFNLYPLWKVVKQCDISWYNGQRAWGSFPMGVKATHDLMNINKEDWNLEVKANISKIHETGNGGVFIYPNAEVYAIDPPDLKDFSEGRGHLFDICMRVSGFGQTSMSMDGGGSRNLMASVDRITNILMIDRVQTILNGVNDTMIQNLVKLNFELQYLSGKIKEFPKLIVNKQLEIEAMGEQSADKTQEIREEVVKQSIQASTITQNGDVTKFNFIKSAPQGVEAQIILDMTNIDKMLTNLSDDLSVLVLNELKPEMKRIVTEIVKNPTKDVKVFNALSKMNFGKTVEKALETAVMDSIYQNTINIENALKLGNTTFIEAMGVTPAAYSQKIASQYLKSQAFKDIKNTYISEVTEYARSYAIKANNGFVISAKNQIEQVTAQLIRGIDNLKGQDIAKLSQSVVMKTFTNSSNFENFKVASKNENYVALRCGIFEGQCEHCSQRVGEIYYPQTDGFYADSGEELMIPDPQCKGAEFGNECRCWSILVPIGAIEND